MWGQAKPMNVSMVFVSFNKIVRLAWTRRREDSLIYVNIYEQMDYHWSNFRIPVTRYQSQIIDITSPAEANIAAQQYGWKLLPLNSRTEDWGRQHFYYLINRFGDDLMSNPEYNTYCLAAVDYSKETPILKLYTRHSRPILKQIDAASAYHYQRCYYNDYIQPTSYFDEKRQEELNS